MGGVPNCGDPITGWKPVPLSPLQNRMKGVVYGSRGDPITGWKPVPLSPLIEIIGVDVQGKVQAGSGKRAKEAAQVA